MLFTITRIISLLAWSPTLYSIYLTSYSTPTTSWYLSPFDKIKSSHKHNFLSKCLENFSHILSQLWQHREIFLACSVGVVVVCCKLVMVAAIYNKSKRTQESTPRIYDTIQTECWQQIADKEKRSISHPNISNICGKYNPRNILFFLWYQLNTIIIIPMTLRCQINK